MRVACIGGTDLDIKALASDSVAAGTSNPGVFSRAPGGVAANIARNLAQLGIAVELFSRVGDDAPGRWLRARLEESGVGVDNLGIQGEGRTATYLAVLSSSGELVVGIADMEVIDGLDADWARGLGGALAHSDTWVVDANLYPDTLKALLEQRPEATLVVADPVSGPKASRLRQFLPALDLLLPDRLEAEVLSGVPIASVSDAATAAEALLVGGAGEVVVKMGESGVVHATREGTKHHPAIAVDHIIDVTGAGDSLAAGLLYGRSIGADDPLAWGLAAASMTVESEATVSDLLTSRALAARLR